MSFSAIIASSRLRGILGFISTWDTTKAGVSTSSQIALPLVSGGTYSFDVYYLGNVIKTITTFTDNVITFSDGSGVKEITCVGTFTGFQFNNGGDRLKINSITQFGSEFNLINGMSTFYGCSNLTSIGTDLDVSNVTNMSTMFFQATAFNSDISSWNVSAVTTMVNMFYQATAFNSDISLWDVSNVTSMETMFFQATAFNSDISLWNVSNVTRMSTMFFQVTAFNSDISNWNVSNVTTFLNMFFQATAFNSDISNWNVSNANDMTNMFFQVTAFNSDISLWDFGAVTKLSGFMFGKTFSNYSSANYDALITRWRNNAQNNLNVNMGTIKYSSAVTADRTYLTGTKNWTIIDGGLI